MTEGTPQSFIDLIESGSLPSQPAGMVVLDDFSGGVSFDIIAKSMAKKPEKVYFSLPMSTLEIFDEWVRGMREHNLDTVLATNKETGRKIRFFADDYGFHELEWGNIVSKVIFVPHDWYDDFLKELGKRGYQELER